MKELELPLQVMLGPLLNILQSDRRIASRFGLRVDCVTTALLDALDSPSAVLSEQVRLISVPRRIS